jgi:hypothetical protein
VAKPEQQRQPGLPGGVELNVQLIERWLRERRAALSRRVADVKNRLGDRQVVEC